MAKPIQNHLKTIIYGKSVKATKKRSYTMRQIGFTTILSATIFLTKYILLFYFFRLQNFYMKWFFDWCSLAPWRFAATLLYLHHKIQNPNSCLAKEALSWHICSNNLWMAVSCVWVCAFMICYNVLHWITNRFSIFIHHTFALLCVSYFMPYDMLSCIFVFFFWLTFTKRYHSCHF